MKENVLFILVDCLRADKIYGNNRTARTPNIDKFMEQGVFFSTVITPTPCTTPSVASILTGLYPSAYGIFALNGYKLADNVMTLAEIFKENGYHTYAEVTGPLVPYTGLDRGFDSYTYRDSWKKKQNYFVDKYGETLISKFKNNEFREPWFIFIHLWELHEPRYVQAVFDNSEFGLNRYERSLSGLDTRLGGLFKNIDFNTTAVIISSDHGERIAKTMFDEYLYEIKQYFRKLRRKPRKIFAGIVRKTFKLFRLSYDKLPDFSKHDYIPKNRRPTLDRVGHDLDLYDHSISTPLIAFGNKKISLKNRFISSQVRQIDIFPTVIDILDLQNDRNFNIEGQSLLPLIKGEIFNGLAAYCYTWNTFLDDSRYWKACLRNPKYKLILSSYNNKKQEELYDLEKDRYEKQNIILSNPYVADELRKQLFVMRNYNLEKINLSHQRMSEKEEKALTERLINLGYV